MRTLLIALLFAPLAWAETRFYEVEVLVFQHTNDPLSVEETIERGLQPIDRPTQMLGLDADLQEGFIVLQPYPAEQRQLNEQAMTLRAQGKNVLFHERWLHGMKPAGQDRAVAIMGGQDLGFGRGFELQGSIEFSIARFIQADVDLIHQRILDGSAQGPYTARLSETRRARSGVVHYLDHPMFGVLISYTRTEDS